ncbi:hypothetical protein KKA08_08625, partial [bacterium]|nr:hypothetical protein [bacterium]
FFKHDIAAEFDLIEPPLVRYWKLLQEAFSSSINRPPDYFRTGPDLCRWVEHQPHNLREQMSSILKQQLDHSISQ